MGRVKVKLNLNSKSWEGGDDMENVDGGLGNVGWGRAGESVGV